MPEFTPTVGLQLEFMARIVLSAICGMLIGWEREKRLKSAGLRTHMLV
ncbi:MAG: MgtC/SapB family protein, partial [Spirochaetales bacterium]|nr:MgtC/SapB family protein [Candidatus Physcosoma equi]